MVQIDKTIALAEENLLNLAEEEVVKIFYDEWLPSHDADHHKRVWMFAKELLKVYSGNGVFFDEAFVKGLLLACFFHDTGLTRDLGFEHGKEGAALAKTFINKLNKKESLPVDDVLTAIKNHDDKTYLSTTFNNKAPGIYDLLTVADDLDAFGALGLYRYFEIYHLREIKLNKMHALIADNLMKRYSFVEKVISIYKELLKKHYNRFQAALQYLEELSQQDIQVLLDQIDQKRILEDIPNSSQHLQSFITDAKKELSS